MKATCRRVRQRACGRHGRTITGCCAPPTVLSVCLPGCLQGSAQAAPGLAQRHGQHRHSAWRLPSAAGTASNDDHGLSCNVCTRMQVVAHCAPSDHPPLVDRRLVSGATCRKHRGNVPDQPMSHRLHSTLRSQESIHEGRSVKRPLKYVNARAFDDMTNDVEIVRRAGSTP
jgi:hypothetical protein